MSKWNKKNISKEVVKELHDRFGCDFLTASILTRRNITTGNDVLFFLEDDTRFLHNPFLFNEMEDAVDRILDAKDEGEKVLIFGDKDVDGVTSTALLYEYLCELGIDVVWRLPTGDDAYGLSIKAIDDFAAAYGTLIITVDCGISNNEEIAYANELGIDTIVVDHHNPPEVLPDAAVIINPKIEDSGYPFQNISGCAVTYKLICALRFSQSNLYKQDICLVNVRPLNEAYVIEAIKLRNMAEKSRIAESVIPNEISISQTRLLPFLQGQQIFVWDAPLQKKQLQIIFGSSIEFNMMDLRPEISKVIPAVANFSLLRLKDISKTARYNDEPTSELDGFFNIFITYVQQLSTDKTQKEKEQADLQLVCLATLADIMPLENENRIFVRQGLQAFNSGLLRNGLKELFARLNILGKRLSSTDLSWNVIPVLNAAGRLGNAQIAANLLLEKDPSKRDSLAATIIQMNKDRKQLGIDAWNYSERAAYESLSRYDNKMVIVADERINKGVTGIIASQLAQYFKVPAIVITFLNSEIAIGSIRSFRGYDVTALLDQMSDLFINYGGHNAAAGFSFTIEKLPAFTKRLETLGKQIEFPDSEIEDSIEIDAELPHKYMTADLLNLIDKFEPYGEKNEQLILFMRNTKILTADIIGKIESKHLKLTLDCGKHKWPALFWNAAERLNKDFSVGDKIDAVFQITRNVFNGVESPQIVLTDMILSTKNKLE